MNTFFWHALYNNPDQNTATFWYDQHELIIVHTQQIRGSGLSDSHRL